jgi:hypothetical protein
MQPAKGVQPEMKEHKLRSGVGLSWLGASKPKGVKQGLDI